MNVRHIVILLCFVFFVASILPITGDAQNIDITTNLVDGETYDGIFTVSVTADDPVREIVYISLYIDGIFVESIWDSPYFIYNWDTTSYSDGEHSIHIHSSAGGPDDDTYADYDVFVNNNPEPTSTTTTDTSSTTPNQTDLNPQLKLTGIGASVTVSFGLLGFILKADFVETKKHKAVIVIAGVVVFSLIAGVILFIL